MEICLTQMKKQQLLKIQDMLININGQISLQNLTVTTKYTLRMIYEAVEKVSLVK